MSIHLPRNNKLLSLAKSLRQNMTKEERHLWCDCLRFCKPRFRRQEIIGNYIADFFCNEARLVIELDGSQHYEPGNAMHDNVRTAYFLSLGITVMRFSNADIHDHFQEVCQSIWQHLESCSLHPSVSFADSSPQGEP